MPRHVVTCVALAFALCLVGCRDQSGPGPAGGEGQAGEPTAQPAESFPNVLVRQVEYYTSGPQQGRPPDGKFPLGTKVRVLRRTGGYSLVRSDSGVEAYVSSDAISEPGAVELP
jgi:hypothetical protein